MSYLVLIKEIIDSRSFSFAVILLEFIVTFFDNAFAAFAAWEKFCFPLFYVATSGNYYFVCYFISTLYCWDDVEET